MPIEKLTGSAIQEVLQSLAKMQGNAENGEDMDAVFLEGVMQSPIVRSLAKVHDTLENSRSAAKFADVTELISMATRDLENVKLREAEELRDLLKSPHITQVAVAHDSIARQCYAGKRQSNLDPEDLSNSDEWETPVRMIGLTKRASDSLGITVAVENDQVVVTRILHGSLIHKQGLMHVGDVICEVDGKCVKGNPDLLKKCLAESTVSHTLKIIPSNQSVAKTGDVFVKCNFDFNPALDSHIPSQEAGLNFKQNEILKIVNRSDRHWWQALHVNNKGEPVGRAGLIPSVELQERRRVIANPLSLNRKKSCRKMYCLSDYYQQFTDDFLLYEEVTLLPPFKRKCILLVSHDSSIAYCVRERLVQSYPNLYKAPLVSTTNSACSSSGYEVVSRDAIVGDIKANRLFEYTDVKGNIFGTKYDAIRSVTKQGKICVKDVLPKNIKFLMTSEFMPYVIFLRPENDIAESLAHCINCVLPHRDLESSVIAVHRRVTELAKMRQWIPVSWVY